MTAQLDELFEKGVLVRPSDDKPNLLHLVRAIATRCGVRDIIPSAPVQQLAEIIGPAEHIIFVLLDGLGMNIVRRLPPESFIAKNLKLEINATFPSTTACALTTVATAEYCNRHGVVGWFTYLPEFELTTMMLPFAERFSGQPLTARGIQPPQILPLRPIAPRMTTHSPTTLTPSYIANSTYNTYTRGDTPGVGYESIAEAVTYIVNHVSSARASTYTHLYVHDIDTLCHHVGIEHDAVVPLVLQLDAELMRLYEQLRGRARIIVTADHGLIDVPAPDQTLLLKGDPMLEMLQVPPTGDARMPVLHVRPEHLDRFPDYFNERYGDRIILLTTEEAERRELFGPGAIAPNIRRRFGDFIGIPFRAATLGYHPPEKPLGRLYLAVHAGLSPDEMFVPLCIA